MIAPMKTRRDTITPTGTANRFAVRHMCLAECAGTFVLVLFGCGAVHAAVLAGAQSGIWQVAVVWGVAIMIAIYMVGAVSGAHINPAVTIALAVSRRHPWRLVAPYIAAQLAGAFLAAATLFVLFGPHLAALEQEKHVVRGQPGSELTAMCYGEYFPSPGPLASADGVYSPEEHQRLNALVSQPVAFFAELLGTMFLLMVIFAVTDDTNPGIPPRGLAPVFIGLTVSGLISFIAPLTQACFNPARDFGPRLFAYFAGWGSIALPGPQGLGFLTVYILAPVLGAILGALFYVKLLQPRDPMTVNQEIHDMPKIPVILIGGFLGAGKTTLIAAAAKGLQTHARSVGVITNDQAAGLVDTAALAAPGLPILEVSGGCFCCRFDDLVTAMDRLVEREIPDLLIGEPVGSCTDLSATVLQPMKQLLADRFALAPFSVVVDATQLRDALQDGMPRRFPDNVNYIYQKQLEEADLIVLNKVDLVAAEEQVELQNLLKQKFPAATVMPVSARTGAGVDSWLDCVLHSSVAGKTITAVDYDLYADGEAALGWLNATVQLEGACPADWAGFCQTFMDAMRREFQASGAEVAHLKLHLTDGRGTLMANLTSNRGEPSIRGNVEPSASSARLLVNARAHVDPARLRSITESCLKTATGDHIRFTVDDLRNFAPSRPTPTHRFSSVVEIH